jgi:hypothetical protein
MLAKTQVHQICYKLPTSQEYFNIDTHYMLRISFNIIDTHCYNYYILTSRNGPTHRQQHNKTKIPIKQNCGCWKIKYNTSSMKELLTCALCDAWFIKNKSSEMLNNIGLPNFWEQRPTLKVRDFNDVEFASMNCIKLIAYWEQDLMLIFTVLSWLRQQLLHSNSSERSGACVISTWRLWIMKKKNRVKIRY